MTVVNRINYKGHVIYVNQKASRPGQAGRRLTYYTLSAAGGKRFTTYADARAAVDRKMKAPARPARRKR